MSPMQMNLLGSTGLRVSRLGLGTAEIGFAYGLGSPVLPDEDDALAIEDPEQVDPARWPQSAGGHGPLKPKS